VEYTTRRDMLNLGDYCHSLYTHTHTQTDRQTESKLTAQYTTQCRCNILQMHEHALASNLVMPVNM